mgnify:CR=1 FL=1
MQCRQPGRIDRKIPWTKGLNAQLRALPFIDTRGCWDGDGGFSVNRQCGRRDQLRSYFSSSSPDFLGWVHKRIEALTGLHGNIYGANLEYYGQKAIALGHWLYYAPDLPALTRKRVIWEQFAT